MRFFEDQRIAKKNTRRLYLSFIMLVSFVSFGIGFTTTWYIPLDKVIENKKLKHPPRAEVKTQKQRKKYKEYYSRKEIIEQRIYNPSFYLVSCGISALIFLIINILSYFKIKELRVSPTGICYYLGAKLNRKPSNFKEKQLLNIVEEMSIASRVPLPKVFILDVEGINAFACGYDINSSAICVTRGCLEKLSRDELQAIIGHEFSHILNGDMTINLKLMGMIHGLVALYYFGIRILGANGRRRRREKGSGVGLVFIIFGGVGWFAGSWLKSRISVQREFLADASSVQFTRNSSALIKVFEKIHFFEGVQKIEHSRRDEIEHMFFTNTIKNFFQFRTHPEIIDRIKRIDKNYLPSNLKKLNFPPVLDEEPKESATENNKNISMSDLFPAVLYLNATFESQNENTFCDVIEEIIHRKGKFDSIGSDELLAVLQILFGELNMLSDGEKEVCYKKLKEEIAKDKKFDYHEFIIYSYLKPALKNKEVKFKEIPASKTREEICLIAAFALKVAKLKDLPTDLELKLIDSHQHNKKLSYSGLGKAFEKLRFLRVQDKEKLVHDLEKIFFYDGQMSSKEHMLYFVLLQILGVPGVRE